MEKAFEVTTLKEENKTMSVDEVICGENYMKSEDGIRLSLGEIPCRKTNRQPIMCKKARNFPKVRECFSLWPSKCWGAPGSVP